MSFPVLNRRRFLGTSLLTAGALALPSTGLAQAWPAAQARATFDANWWWGTFRTLTLRALAMVPEVGGVLSLFGGLFFPGSPFASDDAQWKSYVAAVNRIVDKKVDEAMYARLEASLAGFTRSSRLFVSALQTGDAQHIRSVVDALNISFTTAIAGFMLKGHEARLLPLFVPVANLHLGLLRQAVQQGHLRQFPAPVIADYQSQLQLNIQDYGQYYDAVVAEQLQAAAAAHPHDPQRHRNEPLASVYTLRSQLQGGLGDVRDCWPGFDTATHPGPVNLQLNRELFSMLIGSYFDGKVNEPAQVPLPSPPTGTIQQITLQGAVFVDGLTLSYAEAQGPDGASAVQVGGNGGARFVHDDIVQRGHVRAVLARFGYAVDMLALEFGDGSRSLAVGSDWYQDQHPYTRLGFADHHLSSVLGFGTARGYGGVLSGCMFGFQLDEPGGRGPVDDALRQRLRQVVPAAARALDG
ncbi:insecticidal delta-endotoxin Cry8Ea1 family protein [Stenotrophomonas sp.]|uniref:insecticidal delta-endotoxin Cry8Ea1 family protein n=1 Tax=Stenotrophomonas sp. TaxID=69392 RepID=UPI002FC9B737